MGRHLKKILKRIIPQRYHDSLIQMIRWLTDGYSARSYSQEGEDMILRRIFKKNENGFYVDVGAHHPKRFSNTCYFYRRGWRGVNIDAMPNSMKMFNKARPRDINLEAAISSTREKLIYYMFDDPALNGFSKDLSLDRKDKTDYKIVSTKELESVPLKEILDRHVPEGTQIDFLSIDVEGWEMEILQSNDWDKYRPKVVLIEQLGTSLGSLENDGISQFMREKHYSLYAKTINTVFYLESCE